MFGGLGSVGDEFLQRPLDPVFPGIDGINLEMKFGDDVDHEHQGHAVAQNAGDQFGVVPVFLVERSRQCFNGDLVSLPVFKLEIVS